MQNILLYIGSDNLKFYTELISVGRIVQKKLTQATIYGVGINIAEQNEFCGLDYFINIKHDDINRMDFSQISHVLKQVIIKYNIDLVIIHATEYGRNLAPRVAAKMEVGLVADVTAVEINDEHILSMKRPTYGDKLLATITSRNNEAIMMTVRPKIFKSITCTDNVSKIIQFVPQNLEKSKIRVLEVINNKNVNRLEHAKIVVSGGGGIGKQFNLLEELAIELNGAVGGSRSAVDKNYISKESQIGQSGNIISPDLYIGCGISGAIQHIIGMKNSKYIISINLNKYDPLCSLANIIVEGDAASFITKLTKKIQKHKRKPSLIHLK